ncbi:MAG: alkaline phosphatase family protein [Microscillaceae bacterium]|nr:alkaline phosphatase family protein [Microscillaceae bacterium]
MKKTVVINVVGLSPACLTLDMPFLSQWADTARMASIIPVLPAVTCSAQATYLTGKYPHEHGIVANGWYFRDEAEVKFWKQSNKLIQSPKIWDKARDLYPSFTCANMFWWYNMYSAADYSVTPRPNYLADGRKIPDCYSHPADLRDRLQKALGTFPLFNFWGPNTSIKSSRWIADASIMTDKIYDPTLTLIYLPHLDYNFQRHGHNHSSISKDLKEIDGVCKDLITYYEKKADAQVIILSEYAITPVHNPIHLNRILRKKGYIAIREERGLELLDAGESRAFAVADHQIAHIYIENPQDIPAVKELLASVEGVEMVLDEAGKEKYHLNHERSGELIAVANKDSWFTYYFWLEDKKAPDYARMVDIHKKPGYDPVEMFLNPAIKFPMLTIGSKLLRKKLGFRMVMDVIPLDASLVKGSHGRITQDSHERPLIISRQKQLLPKDTIEPTEVFDLILAHLQGV